MKTKNIILFSLAIIGLSSCDDRLDFIADVNVAPEITLSKDGGQLTSLDVDFKMKDDIKGPGEEMYQVDLFVEDMEGFDGDVQVVVVSGIGKLYDANDNDITGGFSYSNKTAKTIFFDPLDNEGITKLRLTAVDNLGKSSSVEIVINSFLNKVPSASWAYTNIKLNDPYEYELDATASVDVDADLGGAIAGYEWTINGNVFTVEDAKINYILSKASSNGTTYNIKLRVLDNNGEYSTISEKYITVN